MGDTWTWLAVGAVNMSPFFALLALVLALAVLVALVFARFRQSLLVGYLLCGVLIANTGLLRLVGASDDGPVIAMLAEIGVVLLMFTLGVEFSLKEFGHMWRVAVLGGAGQMGVTALAAGLVAAQLPGVTLPAAVVLGVAVGLSSTAVAMKSFHDMGHANHPAARASLGIALFQDLLVILVFMLLPGLFGSGGGMGLGMAWALGKGVLFLCGAWVFGRYGLGPLLHSVARTRSRELFTLTVIGLCAGVAFAGASLDLSLALGAFAAGLVVSESIYAHRVLSEILPFKDLFLAIYFVSVGLMIDVAQVAEHWQWVLAGSAVLLAIKGVVVFGVLKSLKLPSRAALFSAASLASTGEFSLVLLDKAGGYHVFDAKTEQMLLVCTAVTMALVPALMKSSRHLGRRLVERGVFRDHQVDPEGLSPSRLLKEISDHAVICGYGPVGRALNEALKRCGVPTLVVELNVDTVRKLKGSGQPVLFADATQPEALDLAGIGRARMVAFTFPAVEMTCVAAPLVWERNPGVLIYGRAKFAAEAHRLRERGVHVIHDERESAVALVRAAISVYGRADIDPEEVVEESA